jgi:hypothetical protein
MKKELGLDCIATLHELSDSPEQFATANPSKHFRHDLTSK